jgi:hypothetical protein
MTIEQAQKDFLFTLAYELRIIYLMDRILLYLYSKGKYEGDIEGLVRLKTFALAYNLRPVPNPSLHKVIDDSIREFTKVSKSLREFTNTVRGV